MKRVKESFFSYVKSDSFEKGRCDAFWRHLKLQRKCWKQRR